MKRSIAAVAIAVGWLALSGPLCAQAAPEVPVASAQSSDDAAALFRTLDANGDGVLSTQELTAPAASRGNWIAVDRNGDGRITRDEFGLVRNFAARPSSAATGGTRPGEPREPKAAARP